MKIALNVMNEHFHKKNSEQQTTINENILTNPNIPIADHLFLGPNIAPSEDVQSKFWKHHDLNSENWRSYYNLDTDKNVNKSTENEEKKAKPKKMLNF